MKEQDHRVRVTQLLIRKAFVELLAEKPVQSVTVKELCTRAGVNRSTFYAHYQDVYELKRRIEEEMYRDIQKTLSPLLDDGSHTTQLQIAEGVFSWLKENRDMCAVILSEYGDKSFLWNVLLMGRVVCRESYVRSFGAVEAESVDWFYAFVSAGFIATMRRWLNEDMKTPANEVARIATGLMLHGADSFQKPQ